MSDPYACPGTGVLYNKLGLSTWPELHQAEREVTRARELELYEHPPAPTYDLEHFRAVHRHLFGDIYDWAGEPRTVNMAKEDCFAPADQVVPLLQRLFQELADEGHLRHLGRLDFLGGLTHYLGELNGVHFFREGNGRAQRAWSSLLARDAGWRLDWSGLDEGENVAASVAYFRGDAGPLVRLLHSRLSMSSAGAAPGPVAVSPARPGRHPPYQPGTHVRRGPSRQGQQLEY